ncbi:KH domain-containing, RNA-binding, signal transduction-associated protein 2 [Labeo rohita]|uniref:KH domain-containing, RNA-binding, signal transduction-associated protein 2 n=1 Tax=Labeo rohita TaxID=84645 RepID=A0ABQ8M4G5_LABRO|nr:KH domain-containing, RNA-binding, signal transduction-associated protein 2 [Labeo rohita]
MKRLQEETGAKMSILGKGSMRDKGKEEELRKSGEAKYAHLSNDLHVLIEVFAPPGEAYSRMSHALEEIKKFLVPDYNDEIRQEQLRELSYLNGSDDPSRGRTARGRGRGGAAPPPPPGRGAAAPRGTVGTRTSVPTPTLARGVSASRARGTTGTPGYRAPLLQATHKSYDDYLITALMYISRAVPDCLLLSLSAQQLYSKITSAFSEGSSLFYKPGYDDGYDGEYDDQSYEGYDDNYSNQSKSVSEYYEYGHGNNDEAYNNYEEDWISSRPNLKAPASRLTRGGYRDHPYGRY